MNPRTKAIIAERLTQLREERGLTRNQGVGGSSPPWLTIYRRNDGGLRQVP